MKKLIILSTIVSSLAILNINAYANNNIDGIYNCINQSRNVILTIKGNLFDIIENDVKLSSTLIPKIKNPNDIQKQLIKSSKLAIDKKKENNRYRLSLKMSYKAPNKIKKNFIKKLGTLKKDIDGSLNINILDSEINCIKK